MSMFRGFITLSVVIVCAAASFGGAQAYILAKSELAPVTVAKADPIASKLAEDSDLTGAPLTGTMSPIYPTTKYTLAQLALPAAKKTKTKVAVRAHKMPMQLSANTPVTAYAPAPRIADRSAPIFASIR